MDDFLEELRKHSGAPAKPTVGAPVKNPFDDLILDSANRHGVDPDLIRSMMKQESSFKPKATSYKGASGLMQLMPATAQRFGVTDIYDPKQNIEAGTKYAKWLLDRYKGNVDLMLAGYNAGEGNVDKYGDIPPFRETQDYVKRIRSNYRGGGYLSKPVNAASIAAPDSPFLSDLQSISQQPATQPATSPFLDDLQKASGTPPVNPQGAMMPQQDAPVNDLQGSLVGLKNQLAAAKTPLEKRRYQQAIRQTEAQIAKVPQTGTVIVPQDAPQIAPQVTPQVNPPASRGEFAMSPDLQAEQSDINLAQNDGFQAWANFNKLAPTPQNRAKYDADLAANQDFGKVAVSSQVNAPQMAAQQTPQQQMPQTVPQTTSQPVQPTVPQAAPSVQPNVANSSRSPQMMDEARGDSYDDIKRTQAGVVGVDLANKPANMPTSEYLLRNALKGLQGQYGYTDGQIDQYISNRRAKGQNLTLNDKWWDDQDAGAYAKELKDKTGDSVIQFSLNRGVLADLGANPAAIVDGYKAQKQELETNAAEKNALQDPMRFNDRNQTALDTQFRSDDYRNELSKQRDLQVEGIDPNLYAQAESRLRQNDWMPGFNPFTGGSVTDKDIKDEAAFLKEAALSDVDKQQAEDYGRELGKTRFGELYAGVVGSVPGMIDFFNGYIGRPLRALGIDFADKGFTQISDATRRQASAAASTTPDNLGKALTFIGSLPLDLTRVIVLSRLPGGAITGFAVNDAAIASGQYKDIPQVAGAAIKGAGLGAIFGGTTKAGEMLTEAGLNSILAKGFKIGSVGTLTYPYEKAFGATDEEALHASLMNVGFELFHAGGEKALGKIYKVWTKGKPEYIYLDENKNVSIVPEVEKEAVAAEIMPPKEEAKPVQSPIERRQQVIALEKLGWDKEINNIDSETAKEIIAGEYTPKEWKAVNEGETKLGLEDKLNGNNKEPAKAGDAFEKATDEKTQIQEPPALLGEKPLAKNPNAESEDSPVVGFTTSKGSTYTVDGQSTTRNKSDHSASGHDSADVGQKKPSEVTYYTDKDGAGKLGLGGIEGKVPGSKSVINIIDNGDGTFTGEHLYYNPVTKKWSKLYQNIDAKLSTEPKVGLHPIELWGKTEDGGKVGYTNSHAGNDITELSTSKKTAESPKVKAGEVFEKADEPKPEPAKAETPDAPKADAPETPKAGLTRNFRAGTNDATLTFDSETQRDLYDLAAKEKHRMRGGQNKTSDRAVGDIEGLKQKLIASGVKESDLVKLSQDVYKDVRAQMKGVKHLEERTVADNVLPKPKSPAQVEAEKVESELLKDSEWSKGRDAFAEDEGLHKFISNVGDEIDNGKIKKFEDLKPISQRALIAKGRKNGLDKETVIDTVNEAIRRHNETSNDRAGSNQKSEPQGQAGSDQSTSETPQNRSEPERRLPERPVEYGAKNKLVTLDDVAKARELLKKKGTQFNAGIDPEGFAALTKVAAFHIEAGARDFADFGKAMIKEFGREIKPRLRELYDAANNRIKSEVPQFKLATGNKTGDAELMKEREISSKEVEDSLKSASLDSTSLVKDGESVIAFAGDEKPNITMPKARLNLKNDSRPEYKRAQEATRLNEDAVLGKPFIPVMSDNLIANGEYHGGELFAFNEFNLRDGITWASVDVPAAQRVMNAARRMKDAGHDPIAVVWRMGDAALTSNSAVFDELFKEVNALGKDKASEAHKLIVDRVGGLSIGADVKKAIQATKDLNTLQDVLDQRGGVTIPLPDKAKIFDAITHSNLTHSIPVQKWMQDNNISTGFEIVNNLREPMSAHYPSNTGVFLIRINPDAPLTVGKEVPKGYDPTSDRKVQKARQQMEKAYGSVTEAGLAHPNYPVNIPGEVVGVFDKGIPLTNIVKSFKVRADLQPVTGIKKVMPISETEGAVANKPAPGEKQATLPLPPKDQQIEVGKGKQAVINPEKNSPQSPNSVQGNISKEAQGMTDVTAEKSLRETSLESLTRVVRRAFPKVEMVTDKAEFDAAEKEARARAFRFSEEGNLPKSQQGLNASTTVYGMVLDGKIYLNPQAFDVNTVVHETGHIWLEAMKAGDGIAPRIYRRGIDLVQDSPYLKAVLGDPQYKKLRGQMSDSEWNEFAANEALASAIGDKGEQFARASLKQSFGKWLKTMFGWVKQKVGFKNVTADELMNMKFNDFVDRAATDILKGEKISDISSEDLSKQSDFRPQFSVEKLKEGNFDAEEMDALTKIAAFHIEAGARKFADFSKAMVEDFGKGIEKHLPEIYENVQRDEKLKPLGIEDAPKATGVSKVGKSIEAKTIEDELAKSFDGTAEYDKVTVKDQAEKAAKLVNSDLAKARAMINGTEKLPDDLRAAPLITAVETYARTSGDVALLKELANSPLTAETSRHAQELRLLRERQENSPVKMIQDLQNAREEAAQKRLGKKTTVKEEVGKQVDSMREEITKRTTRKHDWDSFVKSIEC